MGNERVDIIGEKISAHLRKGDLNSEANRAEREEIDFLLSWEVMRESLSENEQETNHLLSTLRNPKVFCNLPVVNITAAFKRMDAQAVDSEQIIMNQGDQGDYFYIIQKGRAEVWQTGLYDNEQQKVATLETGDHFGEEALVTGGTRNATVKMISPGNLLCLSSEDFKELISKPSIEEIDAEATHKLIGEGHAILDVRYEEEYDDEHIPDVQLIPLPELRGRLDELKTEQKYITCCHSGKRSAVAAMLLRQNGFQAISLQNGIRDWPYEKVSEY